MQRKMFWIIFASLGLIADFVLPFWWEWRQRFRSASRAGGSLIVAIGSEVLRATNCAAKFDFDARAAALWRFVRMHMGADA
jgi:hypothetical protein